MKRKCTLTVALASPLLTTACTNPTPDAAPTEFTDSAGIQIAFSRIQDTSPACDLSAEGSDLNSPEAESARSGSLAESDRIGPLAESDRSGSLAESGQRSAREPIQGVAGESLRIGSVEGDEDSLLLWLSDAARLSDGRIVAVSRGTSEVKVFSPEGELLARMGGRGGGPGEFRNLWSVHVGAADTLVVADYRPYRFSHFTPEGDFVRAVQAEPPIIERPDVVIVLPPGRGYLIGEACCYPERGFAERSVPVQSYTADGLLSDTVGVFWYDVSGWLSQELGYLGPPIFGRESTVAHYRDDLLAYAPTRHEQVEIHRIGGQLARIIRWQARDRTLQPGDADEWKRQYVEMFPTLNDPDRRELRELHVGDQRPVSALFPGNEGMLVGREGRIWVKEFRRPFDTGPNRWFVFKEDGAFHCQVQVPEAPNLLEVGGDYVLTRETDELDVEYLVLRTLSGPRPATSPL